MKIKGIPISKSDKPFIIAEMSANHNGSYEDAVKLIDEAKISGASAVKLQTYTPDTITFNSSNEEFKISGGIWDGRTLYDLYEEAHTPWDWHEGLFDYANKIGIVLFSSPFDETAIELLERFDCPAYKIASFEAIDHQLIASAASTGKPLVISTGMANLDEISAAVNCARENGCKDLALLHCVSSYPASPDEYNLSTLNDISNRFDCEVGLSDHTLDNTTAITSIGFGATIIEKHFTLNRSRGGPDDSFSLEPKELSLLVKNSEIAWRSIGKVNYDLTNGEKGNIKFRRSLYIIKDIKKGEKLTNDIVKSIRPGYGLSPKFYNDIIGKRVNKNLFAPHALNKDDIE